MLGVRRIRKVRNTIMTNMDECIAMDVSRELAFYDEA
jgi:hypothetical protein